MDVWVGECLPCKMYSESATQDEAVAIAVKHRRSVHPDISDVDAATQFIGHVQLRAHNAIGVQTNSQPDTGAAPPAPLAGDQAGAAASAASTDTQAATTDAAAQQQP